jgi:transposase
VHARRRSQKRKGFTERHYARLLDAAHQQLAGPVVLVWDNLNTHVSRAMSDLSAARDWLRVFRLPPYASEFNPVELTALTKTRLRPMQYRPGLLEGFLAGTKPDLTPLQ